jgi:antitoxin PrlF
MAKQDKADCCGARAQMVVLNNCQIESLLTVDERGQMVLPKEVRQRAGIKPGDKLGLITLDKGTEICCFLLIKANKLAGQVKNIVGPIVASELAAPKRKGKNDGSK